MIYGPLIFDLKQAPRGHLPSGPVGDISLTKRVTLCFGGFGLERVSAISKKLDECVIK